MAEFIYIRRFPGLDPVWRLKERADSRTDVHIGHLFESDGTIKTVTLNTQQADQAAAALDVRVGHYSDRVRAKRKHLKIV